MFWRGDHTFQAASRIRSADGRKDYAAIYSIMNEWSQIVGQWAVGDTSFEQYESGLADVLKRYEDLGYQVIVKLCSSMCLQVVKLLSRDLYLSQTVHTSVMLLLSRGLNKSPGIWVLFAKMFFLR